MVQLMHFLNSSNVTVRVLRHSHYRYTSGWKFIGSKERYTRLFYRAWIRKLLA